jgi:hypothetical protein
MLRFFVGSPSPSEGLRFFRVTRVIGTTRGYREVKRCPSFSFFVLR